MVTRWCVPGQVDGCLTGRVSCADHVDLLAGEGGGLGDAAAVEHARADQRLHSGDPEALVAGPGSQDHRPGGDLRAVGERHHVLVAANVQLGDLAHHRRLGAERPGLVEGAVAQLGTTDAEGKAEVVADQRAGAGLPTDGFAVDHDGAQSLRSGVDGGGQSGRSGTDHDDVEDPLGRAVPDTERERRLLVGGIGQHLPVEADEDRERAGGALDLVQQGPTLLGIRGMEGERQPSALEQVTDVVRAGRPLVVHDGDHGGPSRVLLLPVAEKSGDQMMEVLVG